MSEIIGEAFLIGNVPNQSGQRGHTVALEQIAQPGEGEGMALVVRDSGRQLCVALLEMTQAKQLQTLRLAQAGQGMALHIGIQGLALAVRIESTGEQESAGAEVAVEQLQPQGDSGMLRAR